MQRFAFSLPAAHSFLLSLLILFTVGLAGCVSPWFSPTAEKNSDVESRRKAIKTKLESEERPTLIAQIASPAMLTQSRLQNIGLVTQLPDTGGSVNSSQQREKILDAMRVANAYQPNKVLDDKSTTMVVASVDVPPAARKGDTIDIAIQLSTHANATDLEHGMLLETPLMEMSRLDGQVREGFDRAVAEGSIVTRQQLSGADTPRAKLEGIIVGGGKLLKGRQMGISVDHDFADAITMSAIVPAINRRFTHFDGRRQTGIATPREDSYVEVVVPKRYRLDPFHFINVVLQIGFNETETQRLSRIETLKKQLTEPTTVRTACWQLEALGEEAVPILTAVLDHSDPEIRFYAAHSLAYLNAPQAVPALVSLSRQQPAFRAMCFNGLVVLDSYEAGDALRELVHAADAEVKYGAIRALRQRDRSDPQVIGEQVFDAGNILEVPSSGPPLVAVSLSEVPEIVLYGGNPTLHIPAFQYVNPRIIVSPAPAGGLTISHFRTGHDDQVITTPGDLRSTLTAIAEVGGRYGDWVNFIRECHQNGYLVEPMAINPIPRAGRTYHRNSGDRLARPSASPTSVLTLDDSGQVIDNMAGASSSNAVGSGTVGSGTMPESLLTTSNDDTDQQRSAKTQWYNPLTWGR